MKAREMTEQEMWDFLDREEIISFEGEGWTYHPSKLRSFINKCDCLACNVRRALWTLGISDS